MRSFKLILLVMAALCVAYSGTTLAAGFKAQPWVFDPDGTGVADAAWVTHEGLPDAGKSNHALYLQKAAPTSTLAAGGADVTGVEGITLSELGFDYRNDGHCGAGAPRFNVYVEGSTYFFFGCIYGIHTPAPDDPANWTRVRFTNADAFPADGVSVWPGFGNATITAIEIVFDEGTEVGPGYAYLDNIDVNGTLIGKPGNAN